MKKQNLPILPLVLLSIIFTAVLFLISLYFQNQQSTPLAVPQGYPTGAPTPQVFISPQPTADPYATWKTYTNPDFGFRFKYPSEYKMEKENDILYFNRNKNDYSQPYLMVVNFQKLNTPAEMYIQKTLALPTDQPLKDFCQSLNWQYSSSVIDDYNLITLHQNEGPGDGTYHTYIYSQDIIIDFSSLSSLEKEKIQILSTFKFFD